MSRRWVATFVIIGMLFLGVGAAEAQVLGIKGGVNLSTITFGNEFVIDATAKPGLVAGAFVRLSPLKALPLQIEGLVTQRILDLEGAATYTVTYLEIPVLVRYPLLTRSTLRIRAHGGASFGVLIMAKDDFEDIKSTFAPWDAALVAGAEVEWKDRWVFDVRYLFGVTDMFHPEVTVDFPGQQRAVQITAGYRFK